jgi:hypothetical protein
MISIEHCHMSDQCTQRWEALEPVLDNPRVRYCGQCQSAVHLAEREKELVELARQGKCVAVMRTCVINAS